MTVNKLQRFAEIAEFDHVLEYTDYKKSPQKKPKGQWNEHIFGNENPITLELACGRGDYTVALARQNPHRNYVGIDIKGARIWKGAKRAKAEGLQNVRFIRMFINHLDEYFASGEVSEIWITFPDPYPRAGDRSKRLSSPRFLSLYKKVLSPGGIIHFKTDATSLFDYTCRTVKEAGGSIIKKVGDIYEACPEDALLSIKTTYEKKHLQNGKTISYCKFTLD